MSFRIPALLNHSSVVRLALAAVLVAMLCGTSRAAVTAIGDVLPADNIATEDLEGLPPDGNGYNINQPANEQDLWESNYVVPGYEDIQAGIVVGQKLPMGGRLDIDGNSQLRYQTLVIGDQGLVGSVTRRGTGTVLITGIGALYSNDPNSIPPGLPANFAVDPEVARATDFGFDLYVGRYGQGKLELRNGGRAEIQDAVVVGDQPGSIGEIVVDGFGTLLASGGFAEGSPTDTDPHQIIIGRRALGMMSIRNGGQVVSESAPAGGSNETVIGAVLGSDPYGDEIPESGGTGIVTVNGLGSKWVIGGSLQIGGFHDSLQGMAEDVSGTNVQYNSEAGRGTLYVQDGAVVDVRNALEADSAEDELVLAIGRFGRLELAGGLVTIGGTVSDDESRQDTMQLINDGVITGSGRIETGVFRNRYVGEVRVNPGQSLVVDSSSEFTGVAGDIQPMANYGVMRVLGTADQRSYLEFERAPEAALNPIQPFQNLRVERPAGAPLADFYGGLISAQHSTMLFRSGIENSGMMAFTAGMNYVTGTVDNLAAPLGMPADFGIVRISGPGTRVVFENDFFNGGQLTVSGGASFEVLERHSFVTAGELKVDVNPANPTPITTAGDVGIADKLSANLINVTPGSLVVGQTIELITFGGEIGGVDLTDPQRPRIDLSAAPLFSSFTLTPSLASLGLGPGVVIIPEFTLNSVVLAVRSTAGVIGPDFNGDGMVDGLDLLIWKNNKGITMGASVLQGDANGDGAVDGADYLIWLEEFTMPPGSGSGSGYGNGGLGNVPEPSSLLLLAMGGLLAASSSRRRAR